MRNKLISFTTEELSNLLSDAILAPLALAVSPQDGSIVFANQQWEIAKSTIRTLIAYFSILEETLEIDTILINSSKKGKIYNLIDLSSLNLESLFDNPGKLLEELSTVIPHTFKEHIKAETFKEYFNTTSSPEETFENEK